MILGFHWALIPIALINVTTMGYDNILAVSFGCSFAQCAAVVAVLLRSKKQSVKDICLPAFVTGMLGVTEPAIYGVTLLGGSYRPLSQTNVGPLMHLCVSGLEADTVFVGMSGRDKKSGLMCDDLFEAEALRAMAQHARKCVLLADSTKFYRRSVVPLGINLDDVPVVTDEEISKEAVDAIENLGAQVIVR